MNRLRWLLLAITLFIGILVSISAWLLAISVCPEGNKKGKDIARAWREVKAKYPRVQEWHDSLRRLDALCDTFITAPDGAKLHAYYIAHPKAKRTAIVVHGYGENAVDMMHLAMMYERDLGMNVLLPDLRYAGLSEGSHIQMGLLDSKDMMHWQEVAAARFGLLPSKACPFDGYVFNINLIIHGRSMGASTVMMMTDETLPEYVGCFIADCGYTSVWDEFAYRLQEEYRLPPFPFLYLASALCKARFGWNFREASALEQMRNNTTMPTLLIHGGSDTYVPTEMGRKIYAATPCAKDYWEEKGVEHGEMYLKHPEAYTRRVREFIDKYCGEFQVVKVKCND